MTRTLSAFFAIIGITFFMYAYSIDNIKTMIAFAFLSIMSAIVFGIEKICDKINKDGK